MQNENNIECIGNVKLHFEYYKGEDLYNEGDEAENTVLNTFKNNLNPLDVLLNNHEWAVLYHLSPLRKHIVSVMNIDKTQNILEIGAGTGAISGALAELSNSVDCIDLSKRRSYANAYRNSRHDNINIYVGNFEDIKLTKKYDVVVIIGVLEYAGTFINSDKPYNKFLEYVCDYLCDDGKIYLAIENRFGLKYFAGCSEDHVGKPFVGIEGYRDNKVRTFSYNEIKDMLSLYFKDIYFYFPFPDYKLPNIIFSEDFPVNESARLTMYQNYDNDRLIIFDEEKVCRNITSSKDWCMFSNSFLVEAYKK